MLSDWFAKPETPVLRGERILLRGQRFGDYAQWRAVRLESQKFLKPFEPRWTEADLSPAVYKNRLRRSRKEGAAGTDYGFFIFLEEEGTERLVGGITLSNIRRRVAQHVNLGYWMGVNDAEKGIMTRAVNLMLPYVFTTLNLHRIQAACLPDNRPSRRVLEKNGFREEGFAENYLKIDGSWRDHVLYALTQERFQETSVGAQRESL